MELVEVYDGWIVRDYIFGSRGEATEQVQVYFLNKSKGWTRDLVEDLSRFLDLSY